MGKTVLAKLDDDDEIVADGKSVKLTVLMMDGDDDANAKREAAYQKYCTRTCNAWKSGQSMPAAPDHPALTGVENYVGPGNRIRIAKR